MIFRCMCFPYFCLFVEYLPVLTGKRFFSYLNSKVRCIEVVITTAGMRVADCVLLCVN